MDLHFEMILETLLVGAIFSLLVLSFLFFSMGHVLRVDVISRFFRFLVYKNDPTEASDPIDVAFLPASPKHGVSAHRPTPSRFVFLVLTALLYGAGVMVESRSHTDQDGHDAAMKVKAFDAVAHGRLASGADPEPRLAQFVADFDACHRTNTNAPLKGSRDLGRLESDRPKGADLAPCNQIDVRVGEFYHNAKNAVLQQKTYNEELVNLQGRTNFIRSTEWILWTLTWELGIVVLIAVSVKLLLRRRRTIRHSRLRLLHKVRVLAFLGHMHRLAVVRCVLMFGALFAFTWATRSTYDECESQFDKRVFGYFLSLGDRHGSNESEADDEGEGAETASHPKARKARGALSLPRDLDRGDRPAGDPPNLPQVEREVFSFGPSKNLNGFQAREQRDITPRSPYFVFQTAGYEHGEHLEPSAVRKMGDGSRVIVANDADKDGQQMFWLFDVEDDRLVNPEPICTDKNDDMTAAFGSLGSVESMYVGEPNGDGEVEVLAAPTFERTEQQSLVKFSIDSNRDADPDKNPRCQKIKHKAVAIPVENPCAALGETGRASCRIEGMTSLDIKKELFFGVHDVRPTSKTGSNGQKMKPVVAIVRMEPTPDGGWGHGQLFFKEDKLEDGCRHQSGISDLSMRPDGTLYVLTSVDLHDTGSCSDADVLPLPEVAQVRGALWRLEVDAFAGERRLHLMYRFAHKPAGITDIGDGSLLVVFDDDGQRKSPIWAPRTFALEQNEAVFSLLPAAAESRGSQPTPSPSRSLVSSSP
jgi:hypothetical protein